MADQVPDASGANPATEAQASGDDRFRAHFKSLPVPTYAWRKAGTDFRLVDFNDAAGEITRGRITGHVGKTATEMYRLRPDILDDLHRCLTGQTVIKREMPYHLASTGEAKQFVVTYVFIPPDLVMVHTEDITERRMAEEALRQAQLRYEGLVDSIDGIVWEADAPPLKFTFIGRRAERVIGYPRERWLSEPAFLEKHLHPEDRDRVVTLFAELIRERGSRQFEFRMLCGDERVVRLSCFARALGQDRAVKLQGVMVDVTERKQAEEALHRSEEHLRQSQKMEAIGRLAGGMAHDFNNMLTAINGQSDLALRRLSNDDPLRRRILEIKKAVNRAASLTHQILAFSRKQMLQPKVLDLNALVAGMDQMLQRLIGEDIELKTLLKPGLGQVSADPSQIEQILLNLSINARDAMPQGGTLTIETANADLDESYARTHVPLVPGPYVMLAVSDTGIGMSSEVREHIFEPFFTTKETGQGTGMGLATVYGIVKQSGGYIWVHSRRGRGTTFEIYLPRIEEAREQGETDWVSTELPPGTETILLVEDEDAIRSPAREILEMMGYRVLEAARGGEAIALSERYEGPIDLLITDVVMPGMGGRQLAERLLVARPRMRVLYTSGYTDDAMMRHGVLDQGLPFVQKPFTVDALAKKVREVLDA